MYDCQPLPCGQNSNSIAAAVDDGVKFVELNRNSFRLLLSDDAKQMVAAIAILKSKHPKLLDVTSVAHLFHDCAMKVKCHFEDVDQLITKFILATVKSKTRQTKIATIGCRPQPVVTRWGSWLNAALHNAKNLPEVKKIA